MLPEISATWVLADIGIPLPTFLSIHTPSHNMDLFLEILKLTLPSLVVFFTVYFMLKLLLEERQRMDAVLLRQDAQKITLPLRLQAYERLTLLCDRASIPNTLLRVRMPGMTVAQLTHALLIAINQEFDHNTSQQLFVSDTLWRIITAARQQTILLITQAAEGLDPQAADDALVNRLFAMLEAQGEMTPLQQAIVAIRTEAGQFF